MYGWITGAVDDELGVTCAYMAGLSKEYDPTLSDCYVHVWFKNREDGVKKIARALIFRTCSHRGRIVSSRLLPAC